MKIAVIGSGAWGSALACVAARSQGEVHVWTRNAKQAEEINKDHTNQAYLGELSLEKNISASTCLETTLDGSEIVLLAIPVQSLATVLGQITGLPKEATLVSTCKGIDRKTEYLPSQTILEHFPDHGVAALSGPSFAHDVVKGLPTAVTIAAHEMGIAEQVSTALSGPQFRCYASDDILGAELGGALKNVLALAVGAARGMGLGASAEAALIARGFAEITRLATHMGAKPQTLTGLSGLGDITLTCSSPQSRNFTYGMALGKGESLEGLKLAEGAFTASAALRLARTQGVDVPIAEAVVKVLDHEITAQEAVKQLLTRPLKREM